MVTRIPKEYEQSLFRLVQRAWRGGKPREKMSSRISRGEKHAKLAIARGLFTVGRRTNYS